MYGGRLGAVVSVVGRLLLLGLQLVHYMYDVWLGAVVAVVGQQQLLGQLLILGQLLGQLLLGQM